jgi:hypothetical protein
MEVLYYDGCVQNNDELFEFDMLSIACHSTFVSILFGLCCKCCRDSFNLAYTSVMYLE